MSQDAVFVDHTGRRRQVFTAVGAFLGAVLVSVLSLLIAGLLGASPVPLPGLPGGGQGAQHRDDTADGFGDRPATTRAPTPATTTPTTAAPPVRATPPAVTPSATPSVRKGNRPSTHPGNGRPSRSR